MNVYTYSEARRNLADLLDRVSSEGPIKVRRRDAREFIPVRLKGKAHPQI
jgi:PHD/YefM family antitoxin component YafN of YafNO toxin-antitoxin module